MNVNVVFVGHIDHGKSTLIGRLLYDSESLQEGRVREIQKLIEEYKKRFEFAYFVDSFEDELKEDRTIDTTGVMFKGRNNIYTITDVPGHKEFIKNMLTGASHADVAVLIVSAQEGVQEQTRRHAFLLKLLGIDKLFVVVNKMDALRYQGEACAKIEDEVRRLLAAFGYCNPQFIPVSALEGDNVYKRSKNMDWYQGPTLIEALDTLTLTEKEKKLRFVVQDIYTVNSQRVIVGRVESGRLKKGDMVIFQPSGIKSEVKEIMTFEGELLEAKRGDSIGVIAEGEVRRGDVIGPLDDPPMPVQEFLGEAVLLDKSLKKGEELVLKCATQKVRGKIKEIRESIDSETGEVIERHPEEIKENEAATIIFSTEPLVVEKFSEIPELGRFILVRDKNIGAGIVLGEATK